MSTDHTCFALAVLVIDVESAVIADAHQLAHNPVPFAFTVALHSLAFGELNLSRWGCGLDHGLGRL